MQNNHPMTITEKIFALHSGKSCVKAGDLIEAKIDIALANDITGPIAIDVFNKIGTKDVFNKSGVVLVPDHFVPNKDIKSAQQAKKLRDFVNEKKLTHKFDVGTMGIEHALLPEKGIVTAGDLIIGADSHTCTYGALGAFSTGVGSTDLGCAMASGSTWFKVPQTIKVIFNGKLNKYTTAKDLILHLIGDIGVDGALYKTLEFCGDAIKSMDMDGRFTICNMAIEAGAKNGIIEADDTTLNYIKNHFKQEYSRKPIIIKSDENANYEKVIETYGKLIHKFHTEPHFVFEYAHSLSKEGQYAEANFWLKHTAKLKCDPMIYNIMGQNYQDAAAYHEAEACFLHASHLLPGRIYPYYLLTKLYAHPDFYNYEKMQTMANKVLYTQPKIMSTAIREMRGEIRILLKQTPKQNTP